MQASAVRNLPRYLGLLLLPAIVGGVFIVIEQILMIGGAAEDALGGQVPDTVKQALALSNDLAKLFISLSTAVIGGVAYYVKLGYKEIGEQSTFSRVSSLGTLVAAAVSIFFGHLWIVGMRNQLANDYFDYSRPELIWPERLQYYCFIVALCWFVVLALDRETSRLAGSQKSA